MRNPIRDRGGILLGTTESYPDNKIALRSRNGELIGTEDKYGTTRDRNGAVVATGKGSLTSLLHRL